MFAVGLSIYDVEFKDERKRRSCSY